MRRTWLLGLAGLGLLSSVFLSGCTGPKRGPAPEQVAEATSDTKLLDPFLLKDKPEAKQSVLDVRDKAKDGDEVVFQGIVPPANVKPWSDSLAVFKLMAKEDLDDPMVKEEFECSAADTCPVCQGMLDGKSVSVEIVSQSGSPLKTTVKGFQGLQGGSLVTVKGKVVKNGKNVRVIATGVHVG